MEPAWLLLLLLLRTAASTAEPTVEDALQLSLPEAVQLLKIDELEELNIKLAEKDNDIKKQKNEMEALTQKHTIEKDMLKKKLANDIETQKNEMEALTRKHAAEKDMLEKKLADSEMMAKFLKVLKHNQQVLAAHQTSITTQADRLNDPQCNRPFTTLTDSWRKIEHRAEVIETATSRPSDQSGTGQKYENCDMSGFTPNWYRFSFANTPNGTYARIPTHPPPKQYQYRGQTCGTTGTAWMDGSLPTIGSPPKDVTMKFAWGGIDDYNRYRENAKVVACLEDQSTYYLYYLNPANICDVAYCATTDI